MTENDTSLADKVVVVTGASGGIGQSICEKFLERGSHVVALDLDFTEFRYRDECLAIECDIASESSVQDAVAKVRVRFGRCDVLVNNAAILAPVSPILDTSLELWERVVQVNLTGVFLTTTLFGRLMLEASKGSVINVGSIGASCPSRSAAYGPSKAGVLAFTRQLAVEWGPLGIRTNSLSPGLVRTPMSESFYADEKRLEVRSNVVPLRRVAVPDDMASVIAFLASDDAAYINGHDLVVDGGFLAASLFNVPSE